MTRRDVAAAANRLGLRLHVTDKPEETAEAKATKFADALERQYDAVNHGSFGGLRFSNTFDVDDYPQDPVIIARATEILDARGYDIESTEYDGLTQKSLSVRMSPRDPNG